MGNSNNILIFLKQGSLANGDCLECLLAQRAPSGVRLLKTLFWRTMEEQLACDLNFLELQFTFILMMEWLVLLKNKGDWSICDSAIIVA